MLEDQGASDLQPGFFVSQPMEAEGDVTPGVVAAGEAATVVHEGPYETLGQSWERVHEWIGRSGRSTSSAAWEAYLTDPTAQPDPSTWRTRIVVPLDAA